MSPSRAVARRSSVGADSPFNIAGYLVVNIGDQQFTLDGTVGTAIVVEFHRSFNDAVPVGTIPEIAGAVGKAFGLGDGAEFKKTVEETIEKIPLPDVVTALKKMVVKITDLAINTSSGVYQFGFCCDFSAMNIGAGDLKFGGFGIRVTYTKAPKP